MSLLLWLLIVNIAVVVHELAHYWAARAQGVRVRAFSVGMGPILLRHSWRGTEWRLSALPLGGYVDIEGLGAAPGPDGQPVAPTTGMARLPYAGRLAVLAAGPISNLLLAILLVGGALFAQGEPLVIDDRVELAQVVPGSAADRAGLLAGDVIVALDGRPVRGTESVREWLRQDGAHTLSLQRGNTISEIRFAWSPARAPDGKRPLFGVALRPVVEYTPVSLPQAMWSATSSLIGGIPQTVGAFVRGLVSTFSFTPNDEIVGPVGTVGAVGAVAGQGLAAVVALAGIINLSLGVFNLLPIPGLDGGRILLTTVVAIRRRPFRPGQEELINFVGFAFVLVFVGLVTLQDIARRVG